MDSDGASESARNMNSQRTQVQMQSGPVQQGDSAYSGETDADLLVYMSMGKDDLAASRSAWEEFYSRHARYLYAVSLRAYRRSPRRRGGRVRLGGGHVPAGL